METVKPCLKWVGGKTQILERVLALFPTKIHNYYEPFVGGGSVLLALLAQRQQQKIHISGNVYASDLNPRLIALYKHIQTIPDEFLSKLQSVCDEFAECSGTSIHRKPTTKQEALTSQESYYYWVRSQFNLSTTDPVLRSAYCLFLNKTCFRGIYREGPSGFNVPFGHYKNPTIYDETHIRSLSVLFQGVVFTHQPFADVLVLPTKGDFVYLDPPYVPEATKSFVGYTMGGFKQEDHECLFMMIRSLASGFLLSNSDTEIVKNAFPNPEYTTYILSCRRAIHSTNPETRTNEVLITTPTTRLTA